MSTISVDLKDELSEARRHVELSCQSLVDAGTEMNGRITQSIQEGMRHENVS
jgi:hypothetical protein